MNKEFYIKELKKCTCLESIGIIADFARTDINLIGADYKEVVSEIYADANYIQFKHRNRLLHDISFNRGDLT